MAWSAKYPVNWATGGDLTKDAINKLRQEIDEIYAKLNVLRTMEAGTLPATPETDHVVFDSATNTLKHWDGASWNTINDIPSDVDAVGIPIGGIIIWSGSVSNIPSGFHLCDGSTIGSCATPDLRDRFVVGAGGSYSVGATGGAATHTLTVAEMPSHSHNHTDYHLGTSSSPCFSAGAANNQAITASTTRATTSAGGGGAHNNLPPYYALAYIMRVS